MRGLRASSTPQLPAPASNGTGAGTSGALDAVNPRTTFEQWHERFAARRRGTRRASAISASSLEGSDDPGLLKTPRDLELPPWTKGRYGTAIGRAVHGVLQTVDLATGAGLQDAVAAQLLAENIAGQRELVTQLALSALTSETVLYASLRPHWRETYVGTTVGGVVLEGVVDLLYRDDDGLVVVDYKTDAVPVSAMDSRAAFYRPQLTAYANAVSAATGEPVVRCVLLFLHPRGCEERPVEPLAGQSWLRQLKVGS